MEKDKLLGRIHKLNELIHLCKDEEQGFRQAAIEAQEEKYKTLFLSTSRQRSEFCTKLQDEVRKLGAEPPEKGSITGVFHRSWMTIRDHVGPHRDLAILEECKRGEESALKTYEDIFEFKLLPGMEPLLEPQYVNMIETRNQLLAFLPERKDKGIDDSILHLHP